jgi:hypothetical protein
MQLLRLLRGCVVTTAHRLVAARSSWHVGAMTMAFWKRCIFMRVMNGFIKRCKARITPSASILLFVAHTTVPTSYHPQVTPPKVIICNGRVYKTISHHDPYSTTLINELEASSRHSKCYNLEPPWQICTATPDALHVCATYPWASHFLRFAGEKTTYGYHDRLGYDTALGRKPGTPIFCYQDWLKESGGQVQFGMCDDDCSSVDEYIGDVLISCKL